MSTPVKRNKTVTVLEGTVVKTEATPFLLHDGDFLRLTKLHSLISIWAHGFLAGMAIFIVMTIAKFIDHKYLNSPNGVTSLDWATLGILGFLVLVFYGLHRVLPSERKRIDKKIREHFKTVAS